MKKMDNWEYNENQNSEISKLKKEIKRLKIILKVAQVPDYVIDNLSFEEPNETDVDWAKNKLKI